MHLRSSTAGLVSGNTPRGLTQGDLALCTRDFETLKHDAICLHASHFGIPARRSRHVRCYTEWRIRKPATLCQFDCCLVMCNKLDDWTLVSYQQKRAKGCLCICIITSHSQLRGRACCRPNRTWHHSIRCTSCSSTDCIHIRTSLTGS